MEGLTDIQIYLFIFIASILADLILSVSKGHAFWPSAALILRISRAIVTGLATIAIWSALNEWLDIGKQLSIAVIGCTVLIGVETVIATAKKLIDSKIKIDGGEK